MHCLLREGNLPSVTCIEKNEFVPQRNVVQRIHFQPTGEQERAVGTADVTIQSPGRIDEVSALCRGRLDAWKRLWIFDGADDAIPIFRLLPGQIAALLHSLETRLDGLDQVWFGDLVGRPDDAKIIGTGNGRQADKQQDKEADMNRHGNRFWPCDTGAGF